MLWDAYEWEKFHVRVKNDSLCVGNLNCRKSYTKVRNRIMAPPNPTIPASWMHQQTWVKYSERHLGQTVKEIQNKIKVLICLSRHTVVEWQ